MSAYREINEASNNGVIETDDFDIEFQKYVERTTSIFFCLIQIQEPSKPPAMTMIF